VAGLAAVTQSAGYVTPMTAVLIGLLISPLCFSAILIKGRLGYDDSLDVFGIHGVSGVFGALATGLFACQAVNAAGVDGLFYGNPHFLWVQFKGGVVVAAFAMIMTVGILKLVDVLIGNRVTAQEEEIGLDLTQHGESGYEL
jgi:Amt family ammonium transporter